MDLCVRCGNSKNNHLMAGHEFDHGLTTLPEQVEETPLEKELADLLNKYSCENVSGTPDFVLAEFLIGSLKVFNDAVWARGTWRGERVTFKP